MTMFGYNVLGSGSGGVAPNSATGGTITTSGSIELGHASDTTIARSGSGAITVEGTDVLLAGAQTGITSLLATDILIGEDAQTKIDFETADEIHFYAANVEQVYLADNIFGPQSDSDVDLGTTGVRWKDAFVDSITVTGEVDAATLDISGVAAIDGTLTTAAINASARMVISGARYEANDPNGTGRIVKMLHDDSNAIIESTYSGGGYSPIVLMTSGAIQFTVGTGGEVDVQKYMAIGKGDGGVGALSKYSFFVDRNHSVSAGGATLKLSGDITVTAGTSQEVAHAIFGGGSTSIIIDDDDAEQAAHSFSSTLALWEPNITLTEGTITSASTLHIHDAPTEGVSNYALFVDAGLARFDAGVVIGNVTSTTVATIDDASNGSGSTTLYIGNKTIDTSAVSDARLKENIEDTVIESLSILDQLKLRDFNWKRDDPNYGDDTDRQFGMVAQEVEAVLPHLVGQDNDGIRNVKYNRMIPYLVKAIQELNAELQEIKGGK